MLFQGQTLGKYKILSPLGSGGFGAVYLAKDTWIDKDVAIKVPHKQNLNFSELLREPRLLAALDHPNIVSVTTAEKQDNIFFIVMEYVPGDTLEDVIAGGGALDVDRTLEYTSQISHAVDHAHRQGVIHRDLRPPNVLVGNSGVLKVADFGTSRFLEIAAHGTTVIGSPPYMAPEQFDGKAVFASDLYSLGVTMYQMLTGVLPYDTPAPSELEKLRRGELVRPPRSRDPSIPKAVNDVVMKAMAPRAGRPLSTRGGAPRRSRRDPSATDPTASPLDPPRISTGRRRRPDAGHPESSQGAWHPTGPLLLAVSQTAPRPDRSLPVLWRIAIGLAVQLLAPAWQLGCRTPRPDTTLGFGVTY